MESHPPVGCGCNPCESDHGPKPFVGNIPGAAQQNQMFRTAFWTGCHFQMTLMCIPPCGEIGVEMHPDTDQVIRVESGNAILCMGACKEKLNLQCSLNTGDAVFIPGGTWHNLINRGSCPLKLSSVYAPPKHPRGTIHRTKDDAAREAY